MQGSGNVTKGLTDYVVPSQDHSGQLAPAGAAPGQPLSLTHPVG
jgi:hypothetical protein